MNVDVYDIFHVYLVVNPPVASLRCHCLAPGSKGCLETVWTAINRPHGGMVTRVFQKTIKTVAIFSSYQNMYLKHTC